MRTLFMLRIFSLIAALSGAFFLSACDQAINDRYDGLEVVEVVEVIDTREEEERREGDLFDGDQNTLAGADVTRPNPRPASMSLAGLSSTQAEQQEEPVLILPTDENPQLVALSLPPARPKTALDDANLAIDIRDLVQVSAIDERPQGVANTAEEDQILRLQRAAERTAQAERQAQREEEARQAEIAAREAEAAQEAALQQAEQEASRLASLEIERSSSTQSSIQGETHTPGNIFTPIVFQTSNTVVTTADQLDAQFTQHDFDLSQIMAGTPVPNLIVQRMPEDMAELGGRDRGLMKEIFIKTVLPLCLRANALITAERKRYGATPFQARMGDLSASNSRIVRSLSLKYQARTDADLLERLAPIPTSLCLAQAIHDSDWGRNNAVQNQNGLFGTWSRGAEDPAILMPKRGRDDVDSDSFVFPSLGHAVDAYALFLNRHADLASFRARRAQEAAIGQGLNGRAASLFMDGFRPHAEAYRDRLLRLIDENELDQFDLTRLSGPSTAIGVN